MNKSLRVYCGDRMVGKLALTATNKAAFEYDDGWLEEGFSISPFSLPLKKQVYVPVKHHFYGLFGIFADSLPDAWGNLLMDRMLQKKGIDLGQINILDRLAMVGNSGLGALTYQPEYEFGQNFSDLDLDYLANECKKILETKYSEELDRLYRLGGTSGGARPKIMTKIDGEEWIIKFPAHVDGKDAGKMEFDYSVCAKACGIAMTDTKLFSSKECAGYFGTKRFDRSDKTDGSGRIHMATAAALLELDFRQPNMDYHDLMKLTKILTRDSKTDLENMFRRACFNVFAHNRDDHSKNFTFLYDERTDIWKLSPAYDLTYSRTYYGEHTTTVDGNGRNPSAKELIQVGITAGISKKKCIDIIEEIKECVEHMLGEYIYE